MLSSKIRRRIQARAAQLTLELRSNLVELPYSHDVAAQAMGTPLKGQACTACLRATSRASFACTRAHILCRGDSPCRLYVRRRDLSRQYDYMCGVQGRSQDNMPANAA